MISRRLLLTIIAALPATGAVAQNRRAKVGLATADTTLLYEDAFVRELARLGWRRGDNLELLIADAKGDPAALAGGVKRLVEAHPDVIVSSSGRTHIAVRDATVAIPVVVVAAIDPVRIGLSDSLSRPSRNVTGNIGFVEELMGKRVELIRQILPGARRIGLMLDPSNPAFPVTHADAVAAAGQYGASIIVVGYGNSEEVVPAVDKARAERVDALIVVPDAIALSRMRAIADRARELGIPTLGFNQGDLEQGLMLVLGGDRVALWREAGSMVDRILRGASVSSIPFSRPTKTYLGVNLGRARLLGIEIPPDVVARADEVVD